MNALHIAFKDLQIFLKDRGNIVNLFLLPMVFIVVLSSALGGLTGTEDDSRIPLSVVNLDPDGEYAKTLLDALGEEGGVEVELLDAAQAEAQLQAFEIERALFIPESFSAAVAAGQPATLRLVSHPDANETTTDSVWRVVNGMARGLALKNALLASFQQMDAMLAQAPDEYQVFRSERAIAQAESQFERSKTDPLITIVQKMPDSLGEQVKEPNAVQQNVPGYTIIFVFLTAQLTAYSIYKEKKDGSFRRLLAAPISKAALLAGKMIPNFGTALVQIGVIFAVSIFVLPLMGLERLTLGDDPLALVLVSLAMALCSTGLGIFIAAVARTEAQIGGLAALLLWTMGAVGGCLFPAFLLGGMLDVVGKITPHYWAVQAYHDLIVRGRLVADVTQEIGVLLLFTAVFFIVGLWRFEFD